MTDDELFERWYADWTKGLPIRWQDSYLKGTFLVVWKAAIATVRVTKADLERTEKAIATIQEANRTLNRAAPLKTLLQQAQGSHDAQPYVNPEGNTCSHHPDDPAHGAWCTATDEELRAPFRDAVRPIKASLGRMRLWRWVESPRDEDRKWRDVSGMMPCQLGRGEYALVAIERLDRADDAST